MALVSINKVAAAMNLTPRRVDQLVKEGLPREERGKYDLGKCLLWYIRYLQRALERRAVPMGDDRYMGLGDVRVRSVKADAELKELELARERGQLVPLTDIEQRWTEIVLATKARVLAVAARVAPELVGESSRTMVQAKIEKSLKDALAQLAGGQ